jgi:hypothetical protein
MLPHPFPQLGRARGFTLVELMVAMTGGLFLSVVVFALSRDASRFYQRENRMANATLAGVAGFERLSSDLARAGHMSTPNINADPYVCYRPDATWPLMLRTLRAIIIEDNPASYAGTEVQAAEYAPRGVVISGALSTPEVLMTNSVSTNAQGGWEVGINLATPAAARLGLSPLPAANATNGTIMQSIFMSGGQGKIVRLRANGMDQYAVVANVATTPGQALVNLAATPGLQRLTKGGGQCGIDDLGKDMALTVIDLVRYNIRSMVNDSTYSALFKASGMGTGGGPNALPYEAKRAELVRVELDSTGQEIAATREIVGEYAVDLQFNAWSATNAQNPTLIPVNAAIDSTFNTQLLRGMHVRLTVRSREADRDGDVVGVSMGAQDHYRIPLGAGKTGPYARLRTFQSDIPLRNLEGSNW